MCEFFSTIHIEWIIAVQWLIGYALYVWSGKGSLPSLRVFFIWLNFFNFGEKHRLGIKHFWFLFYSAFSLWLFIINLSNEEILFC